MTHPTTPPPAGQAPAADRAADELTAEEARALADDLGLQLYRAQDAIAFVGECCDIADREGRPVTTAMVRDWLRGARCGRQLAADATDRAALRDRIAEALTREWHGRASARIVASPEDHCTAMAAVVMSLLPPPVDQAAVHATIERLRTERDSLGREADRLRRDWVEMRTRAERAEAEVARLRADRAAVLRWAADEADGGREDDCGCEGCAECASFAIARRLRRLADEAQPAQPTVDLFTLAAALDGLETLIATSSRDWGQYRVDAWLWAVLCGWDCEDDHEHDDLCDNGAAMTEMQQRHGWSDEAVAKARRYRAAVRAVADLATQVRRVADAMTVPVDCYEAADWAAADDAPTTADDGPRLPPMDPVHILGIDPSTSEGVAPAADDGPCAHCGSDHSWGDCAAYTAAVREDAPAADEDTLRTARRDQLGILLSRAGRGVLTTDEAALLRQHVETELREADTARAVADLEQQGGD